MADPERTELPRKLTGRPFQAGDKWTGNAGGRPKKRWLTEVAEELLEEKLTDPEFRKAYKEQLWAKLNSGKVVGAMTLDRVWERTEGKLSQPVELSGEIDIKSIIEQGRKRLDE